MKRMFRFAKTIALVFAGASLVVSCQKDEPINSGGSLTTSEGVNVELKSAKVVGGEDQRYWGVESDWLNSKGVLNFLKEGQNLHNSHSDFFDNVPTGVEVLKDGYLYLTFVGKKASFNNVLGYYYYDPAELPIVNPEIYIMEQIFQSGVGGVRLNQVVFGETKSLEFGTTYQLGQYNGSTMTEFKKGTVVGFYLLPNASGGEGLPPVLSFSDNRPNFIATDKKLNHTKFDIGVGSHIMGKSSCDDYVIAFEDRNTAYTASASDEDYNDMVFVVGDNLKSRYSPYIQYYTGAPFEFNDLAYFGDLLNCKDCPEDVDNIEYLLDIVFKEGHDKTIQMEFDELFTGPSKAGYLTTTSKQTQLYAFFKYGKCTLKNTIGWYYVEGNATPEAIKASVTVDGTLTGQIKEEHLIYKDVTNGNIPAVGVPIAINGGNKFDINKQIGFFIIPKNQEVTNDVYDFKTSGNPVRFTTISLPESEPEFKKTQAQLIMAGSCNTLMVAFEDKITNSIHVTDSDYNDVIFSVSDNSETNKWVTNLVVGNFHSLKDLVIALKGSGKYPTK